MVEIILLCIIVTILPLVKINMSMGLPFMFKENIFILISLLYLCYILIFKGLFVPPLLYLVCFITMSVMWSTNVSQSWQDIVKWWALYGLYILTISVPINTVLMLSVIPLPFLLIWGFLQQIDKEPFDTAMKMWCHNQYINKRPRFMGSLGNTNYTAAFLSPYAFILLYLGLNVSKWFFVLIPFLLVGIILTKCYSAMIGIISGTCVVYPYMLIPLLIFICIFVIFRTYQRETYDKLIKNKEYNFISRIYFCKIAFELWKKKPLFGWGIRSFRREVYEMQAKMNEKDSSMLGYKENEDDSIEDKEPKYTPYPARVHNDYMEMLSDCGIIGFSLMMFFIGSVIYSAIQSSNYILLGGLICLMIHGMFFYTLSVFSYIPYIILSACVSHNVITFFPLHWLMAVICSMGLIYILISYAVKVQFAAYWAEKMSRADDVLLLDEYVDKAISLTPYEGTTLARAIEIKKITDMEKAVIYLDRSITYFDGTMRLPNMWLSYGSAQRFIGNTEGAICSIKHALYLNPRLWEARNLLKEIELEST